MDLLIAHAGGGYVEEQYDTVRNPLKSNALQLSFKVNHTYGIDDVTVKMKIRFTGVWTKSAEEGKIEL